MSQLLSPHVAHPSQSLSQLSFSQSQPPLQESSQLHAYVLSQLHGVVESQLNFFEGPEHDGDTFSVQQPEQDDLQVVFQAPIVMASRRREASAEWDLTPPLPSMAINSGGEPVDCAS